MGTFRKIIFLLIMAFNLSACGGGSSSDLGGGACSALSARGSESLALVDGETCNQNARSAVVAIFPILQNGDQLVPAGICTGTLITVDDVLTSAHCIAGPIINYGSSLAGFGVQVGGAQGEILFVNNASMHPFYDGSPGSPYDIAMLTLHKIPSPAIGPVPIVISRFTAPGDRMSVFGYGTDNLGEVGTLKSGEVEIKSIVDGNLIVTLENSSASICQGDSGGPVVQIVNGVTSLVGVNSFTYSTSGLQCPIAPSSISGFVDIQNENIINFILNYAPDVTIR